MVPDDWQVATVDQIKAEKEGAVAIGPFGSRMKSDLYVPTGIPVIRGNNISDTRVFTGDFVYVSEETANDLAVSNVFPFDLVFPHRGAIGEVGIVPPDGASRYILSTSLMKLTCNRNLVEPLFLFYYFRSRYGCHELLKNASTVGTPGIGQPLSSLKSIQVPLPPLGEQRVIGHILGTLDDKIELNRRMNGTLEAMARAIFKSWFVDFDPVRAKAEGRQPAGMDAETAALFPDSFQDSPLGKIPQGWRPGVLRDLAENPRTGAKPGTVLPTMPYIGLEHMPRRSIALSEWGSAGDVASNKFQFSEGEILFGKLRPYFHKVGVAPVDGVCSTDILVIVPRFPPWHAFVLGHVSSDEFVSYTDAASTGTKMPRTNWGDMERYEIVIPSEVAVDGFETLISPMIGLMKAHITESRTLAAIRDALLPKLISGEIRLRDAEAFAGRLS